MNDQNAIVIGVSPDSDESHQRFRERNGLPFHLVADGERELIDLYDVRRRIGPTSTKRVTYLIAKGGTIRGVYHHELAIGKNQGDVLSGLRELNSSP
ncbi:MAG: redoxin domain-containing protein [Chloroflexi bacterium]|nr:redoxin domain-containing protein [Chloroflexota bacterium]